MSFAIPPVGTATPAATQGAAASGPKRPGHITIPSDNETPINPMPLGHHHQGAGGKSFVAKPYQTTGLTPLFKGMIVAGK
jgi:hypothetical protein